MEHSVNTNREAEASLCQGNCGFFGNPATDGLCSKCFRQAQAEGKAGDKAEASPAPVSAAAAVPEPAAPSPASSLPVEVSAAPEAEAAPAEVASAEPDGPQEPEKPLQANRSRCLSCNKKVGLLGFECRCGYVFCSSHRHAQDHACAFDYQAMDRERLAKANPLVAAAKVDKL